jgi:hypothetical protein
MSETARALGLPGEIQWEGRTLTVSRINFKVEGLFERWLEAERNAGLERCRLSGLQQVYLDRCKVANEQDARHAFAWTSEEGTARKAAWDLNGPGFAQLSFLCVQLHQPGWTHEEHMRLLADRAKGDELGCVMHNISMPHPNGCAPGAEPSGATT